MHAEIAEALATSTPELLDSQPELFAQHYAEAGLIEKSVASWAMAGRRSAARSAMAEAAAQFQKALNQLAVLPDNPDRQRTELEIRSAFDAVLQTLKGHAAPETGDAYQRARELWEELGSPSEFLHVPFAQSVYHVFRSEISRAQLLAEDLLRLSRERNDAAGLVLIIWRSAEICCLPAGSRRPVRISKKGLRFMIPSLTAHLFITPVFTLT
jgi:predicted ATPase